MYYQPDGYPHIKTKELYLFKEPKNRLHSMLEAWTDGGPVLNNAAEGLTGYNWQAFIRDDNVIVKREDQTDEHIIFNKPGIQQLDFTVDQNMRPFSTYVIQDKAYYWHFNSEDSTYSEVALPLDIKYPRCELDKRDLADIPSSDIILGYTRAGNLCYRIQRERYRIERIIATDPKKSMLWKIGKLQDDRFGYQWR